MSAVRHGSRPFLRALKLFDSTASTAHTRPWTCHNCQKRPAFTTSDRNRPLLYSRAFSATHRRSDDVMRPSETEAKNASPPGRRTSDPHGLPSQLQSRRSDVAKRLNTFMDKMLAKATIAGQKVNVYTGTDYSSIELLNQQIVEQERGLKARLDSVTAARDIYSAAHTSQASSQKEVVSLLERKSSWSPTDLDRYTSLIRSEHLHEQSVVAARQALAAAEKELEGARAELERKERKKYHEEQIWSDTIRRNSTWITFALMGFNILLLVANIGIFEPWRRRRLVREVKQALDEKTVTSNAVLVDAPAAGAAAETKTDIKNAIDSTLAPVAHKVDSVTQTSPISIEDAAIKLEPLEAVSPEPALDGTTVSQIWVSLQYAWRRTQEVYHDWARGPLTDDRIILSKVEVTSLAVESAVIGVAVMTCMAALLRG